MPALARAQKVTERASQVGFDWDSAEPVWQKVEEELAELKAACASGNSQRTEEELGDLFFSLVNLSRFLGYSPKKRCSKPSIGLSAAFITSKLNFARPERRPPRRR